MTIETNINNNMTRINSAIPVRNLTDEHLLAEHREIKRLPDNYIKAQSSGALRRIPSKFCLGEGHVTFFLDKFGFTYQRYKELHCECKRRGFEVQNFLSNWVNLNLKDEHCNAYRPTLEEKELLINRITERIQGSTKVYFHYEGEPITKEKAIEILNCKTN